MVQNALKEANIAACTKVASRSAGSELQICMTERSAALYLTVEAGRRSVSTAAMRPTAPKEPAERRARTIRATRRFRRQDAGHHGPNDCAAPFWRGGKGDDLLGDCGPRADKQRSKNQPDRGPRRRGKHQRQRQDDELPYDQLSSLRRCCPDSCTRIPTFLSRWI